MKLRHWVISLASNLSDYMQLPLEPQKDLDFVDPCKLAELLLKYEQSFALELKLFESQL